MKQKQTALLSLAKTVILVFTLVTLSAKTFAATVEDDKKPGKKEKPAKAYNDVRVYPDPIRKVMHVVARGNNETALDFLVFDMEGKMVLSYKMKAGDKKTISGLKKGDYMYHVFRGDEYIESGRIQFR